MVIYYEKIFYPVSTHTFYSSLKSLHLEAICMEKSVFEYVLCNCTNLERLIMWMCNFSSTLPVGQLVVSSNKLKHLVLCRCHHIESFQINAPALTMFTCFTIKEVQVEYRCVPSLVNVTFGGSYCYNIFHNLPLFSDFSHQLEKLSIHWGWECYAPSGFPGFRNVKHLEFAIVDNVVDGDDKLIALISLIEACPLLHTLELELQRWNHQPRVPMSAQKDKQINAIRAHQHLKTVKFVGFTGTASAAELALCLTEHAPMLNNFIFDPRSPLVTVFPERFYYTETVDRIEHGRRQAELLAQRIHRGCVDVVIL